MTAGLAKAKTTQAAAPTTLLTRHVSPRAGSLLLVYAALLCCALGVTYLPGAFVVLAFCYRRLPPYVAPEPPPAPSPDPVGAVFDDVERLAPKGLARERDLLAARVRGLEESLARRGVVVEWKDGTATWGALTRQQALDKTRQRLALEVERLLRRERALGIEVAEERAAKWEAEAERDGLRDALDREHAEVSALRAELTRSARSCDDCAVCNLPVGPGHVVELPGVVTPEEYRAGLTAEEATRGIEKLASVGIKADAFRVD